MKWGLLCDLIVGEDVGGVGAFVAVPSFHSFTANVGWAVGVAVGVRVGAGVALVSAE